MLKATSEVLVLKRNSDIQFKELKVVNLSENRPYAQCDGSRSKLDKVHEKPIM